MLTQLEKKLGLERRIGIEVLIEEVQALQNVEAIATCSDRMESLIFGLGDYSASQGIELEQITSGHYPGDLFHYARFRIAMAARAAGIDAIDGPYGDIKNEAGYREEASRARALGMVGKWAIHPAQIAPAIDVFSPSPESVARARRLDTALREAIAKGLGAIEIDGVMMDVAVLRLLRNTLDLANLYRL
jgi:citrate lyase subunit beta/citryl-CoA lyase